MKPLIAITLRSAEEKGTTTLSSTETYYKAITSVGAAAIFIGPDHDKDFYDRVADMCQGLLLTGGRDINPEYYGQPPHPAAGTESVCIDDMDFKLLETFSRQGKPILGICRGAQDINVYFGGTLYQHLPDIPSFTCNHLERQIPGAHRVTWVADIPGLYETNGSLRVNSLHHQGFDTLAPGFQTAAISEDSLVESIYRGNILAVQWHPERLVEDELHLRLFRYFISLCQA